MTIGAINSRKASTKLRIISVASDGESKRGASFVILTFKHALRPESPLYPLLSALRFLNLWVGDDDLTPDKDFKHVIKRLRNLLLRICGINIMGFTITPAITRSHLREAGHSAEHIHSIFNPADKQDVKLAFDMLRDIWSLPSAAPDARPGFSAARDALRVLGKLFHHIVFPYLCVDLSLSEQLAHLSAAAHLALTLFSEARKSFLPTLLYTDIMIMIKNVFFCVAKGKIDDPDGSFWIVLLGTDRLEELFGILRTMVGNDSNLDSLQLSHRLTGTIEVSNILAKHPEWDRGPRRLKLPSMTRDASEILSKSDHIKPASWRGNVKLRDVVLITAWKRGRHLVESDPDCRFAADILHRLEAHPGADILSPFGVLLVHITLDSDDVENDPEITPVNLPVVLDLSNPCSIELEDAAGEHILKDSVCSFSRHIEINGKEINKARALALRSKYKTSPSSTDRLRRVEQQQRYTSSSHQEPDKILDFNSVFGAPCIFLSEPIATLVSCNKHLFLAIAEVNNITIDAVPVEQIGLDILWEDTVKVSYQIVHLVPTNTLDDPSLKHDWRTRGMLDITSTVSGRLVQPVNPVISTATPHKPFYLWESSVLMALASSLVERIFHRDFKNIPNVKQSAYFPYREASGMHILLSSIV